MTVVHLHIDRLVLNGIAPSDRGAFLRHFQQALHMACQEQQRHAAPDAWRQWQTQPARASLQARPFVVSADAGVAGCARQSAAALMREVGP